MGSDGKKGKICRIIIDVTGRKWRKMKMRHKVDESSNEKMDKQKRNEGNKVDNAIVEKDCNCY